MTSVSIRCVAVLCVVVASASAEVSVTTVAASGGRSAVGAFTMTSVYGQPSALDRVATGALVLEPGFLCVEQSDVPLAGDLNGDGVVDGVDLATLLARWGPCGSGPCVPDIDRSGSVDGVDLAFLLANWG